MTLLDGIIEGATDDSVSTSNLLRRVQVVAHRLEAEEITKWVKCELNGYKDAEDLPISRKDIGTPVIGTWAGIGGSSAHLGLSPGSIPEKSADALFKADLFQSIAELEELADLAEDPGMAWDMMAVVAYNKWIADGLAPGLELMNVVAARKVLTRSVIRGVIDSARNTALDFALRLQSTDPAAGSPDGPTVADPPIAATVYNITTNIHGDGANVAAGDHIRQSSIVKTNDLASLLVAAKELGLGDDASAQLASAVLAHETERPTRIQAFLSAVKAGVFAIGTEMTADLLAGQLQPLIDRYLGQ